MNYITTIFMLGGAILGAILVITLIVVEALKEIILFQLVSLIVMGIVAYVIMRGGEKEKCEE